MQKPGSNSTSSTTNDVVDDDTKTIYNIRKRKKPDYSSLDVKDGYQFPRKSIKPKIPKANASIGTDINRYSAIADDSEDSDMETSQIPEKEATQTKFTGNAKTPTPPPLIIKGKPDNHINFIEDIQGQINNEFYIKYTKYNTNVYTQTNEQYLKLKEHFVNKKLEFYTYTLKTEKTHAFVLRGLQSSKIENSILNELKNAYNTNVIKVIELTTKHDPIYMIITGVETKLRNLNKIKCVNHTKITWERKLSKKKIIQCKNCQQWGHATSNCHSVPNCLKCGEEHATKDCTMAPDSTPKCANCRGPHIASSDDCPVYLYRLTKVKRPFDTQMSQVPQKISNIHHGSNTNILTNTNKNVSFNINDNCFPALPNGSRNEAAVRNGTTISQSSQWSQRNNNIEAKSVEFDQILKQFERTKELINLKALLQALTDYNNILESCTTAVSKFEASVKFFSELVKYDL